jgi:hypothetical protein
MLAKSVQVSQPYGGNFIVVFQDHYTGLSTLKIASRQIDVRLVDLFDFQFFSGLFGFVFRARMLELLQLAIYAFELTPVTFMIPPAGQNMLRMPFTTDANQGAYGVI